MKKTKRKKKKRERIEKKERKKKKFRETERPAIGQNVCRRKIEADSREQTDEVGKKKK